MEFCARRAAMDPVLREPLRYVNDFPFTAKKRICDVTVVCTLHPFRIRVPIDCRFTKHGGHGNWNGKPSQQFLWLIDMPGGKVFAAKRACTHIRIIHETRPI